MTELASWANFFVIVGSSAGALIGLQFVVITLVSTTPHTPGVEQAGGAYATPTIVHFATVLFLSAGLSAPWRSIVGVAILCGVVGLTGVIYSIIVTRRLRLNTIYAPVFEDWLFHAILPFAAYLTLAASAYATGTLPHEAMFGIASAALMLLFVGIHNAWDAVTYHVFFKRGDRQNPEARR